MMSPSDQADGSRLWLPYTQMQIAAPPLRAVRTYGTRIVLEDGRELVDGIASWWTACHGYNHPAIMEAMREQLARMPHVMLGGLVHEPAETLASRLCAIVPGAMERVFFSDSGSVAVEVAMKMAIQHWLNRGERGRSKILAFRGGYHGDTFATMAVCDPEEGMHSLFQGVLPQHVIADLPCDDSSQARLADILERYGDELAAILVEPLVQGAGGMRFHAPDVLRRLRAAADQAGIFLILDEVFTGFGRTGSMFACEQAGIAADIVVLSKALTGGVSPLAATLANGKVTAAFWSDRPDHALMHGPTYMGHALGCAAALASLDLFVQEDRLAQVAAISAQLETGLSPCRGSRLVRDVRVMGAIGVVELDPMPPLADIKARLMERGVWVRPFRNIIYLTPALIIGKGDLAHLTGAVCAVVDELKACKTA
ncbi:Adenosylmethionine-8-amino-7-oxononanoate aminotransferase [Granulibacter bethesdensis CGDNIH4]|nr:Adenosylmethionine-8-amino-7-oxononanoate aminotransferase [Granulibacter bethesdensis CGDNIH4]